MNPSSHIPKDDAIAPEEGELLHALVRSLKPQTILEIGTHKGFSTMYLAQAVEENGFGHVWTVDPFEYGQLSTFSRSPLAGHITYQQIRGCDFKCETPIDFVFIDGFHEKTAVEEEIKAIFPQLSSKATVVFHDCESSNDSCDVNGAVANLHTVRLPTHAHIRIYNHEADTRG